VTKKFEVTLEHDDPDEIDLTMRILRNGVVEWQECDRGEPEDQSFYRDWSWVPDACRASYAYGLEDGKAHETSEWGCDARKKLGDARGALLEAHDHLSVLLACIAPIVANVQSDTITRTLVDAIKNIEDVLERTAQPQLCDKENK